MTRKDYVLIANAVNHALNHAESIGEDGRAAGAEYTALVLASALAADNTRFDRGRFLAACGVA